MSDSFLAAVLARAADFSVEPAEKEDSELEKAACIIKSAQRIVVLTGAGISTDSGIPDFRGPEGLWTKNPGAEAASHIQVYKVSAEARIANWRMMLMFRDVKPKPNAGHEAIATLCRSERLSLVVTQNIDGLHQASGVSTEKIVEVHGGTTQTSCLNCGQKLAIGRTLERVTAGDADPKCLRCGGLLKADVVLFGEALSEEAVERSREAAMTCDVLVAVGSSLTVHPVAGLVPLAKGLGASLIIVNRGETAYDQLADARLDGSISEMLPKMLGVEVK